MRYEPAAVVLRRPGVDRVSGGQRGGEERDHEGRVRAEEQQGGGQHLEDLMHSCLTDGVRKQGRGNKHRDQSLSGVQEVCKVWNPLKINGSIYHFSKDVFYAEKFSPFHLT